MCERRNARLPSWRIFPCLGWSALAFAFIGLRLVAAADQPGAVFGDERVSVKVAIHPAKLAVQAALLHKIQAAADANNTVLFMYNNQFPIDVFLPQTLLAFQKLGDAHRHLVIGVTDQEALAACERLHPFCVEDSWATTRLPERVNTSNAMDTFQSPQFGAIMWRRLELVRDILAQGFNVISMDSDIAYFKDPMALANIDEDLACMAEGEGVNIGFCYFRSSIATIDFMQRVVAHAGQGWEQGVFNEVLLKDPGALVWARTRPPQTVAFRHVVRHFGVDKHSVDQNASLALELVAQYLARPANYREVVYVHFCNVLEPILDRAIYKAMLVYEAQLFLHRIG